MSRSTTGPATSRSTVSDVMVSDVGRWSTTAITSDGSAADRQKHQRRPEIVRRVRDVPGAGHAGLVGVDVVPVLGAREDLSVAVP